MTTVADGLFQYGGSPVGGGLGVLAFAGGKTFFVDSEKGLDGNDGLSPVTAVKTLAVGYGKLTANTNDILVLIGRATDYALAEALDWSKAYTHLVGACAPLPIGQRARITGAAALDLTPLVTFSGTGCSVSNIKFDNLYDYAAAASCVKVTAADIHFQNCTFQMSSSAAAARADNYALYLAASELYFDNCTIGSDTQNFSGGGSWLYYAGASKVHFHRCLFLARASADCFFINLVTTVGSGLSLWIESCAFVNTATNWGTTMTDAITVTGGGSTYNVVLTGDCILIGCTGWADVTTHIRVPNFTTTAWGASQTPAA